MRATDWSSGHGVDLNEEYDAVIVAAGAFDTPYYADTPGLQELLDSGSRLVMHAKTYPGPRPFLHTRNRNKIVVVGNANSANDIAAHLAPLSAPGEPVYRCIRHASNYAHLPDPRIKDVVPIAHIARDAATDTLRVTLVDDTVIDGVTRLIFASGYQYQFEWIEVPAIFDATASPAGHSPQSSSLNASQHKLTPASKYGAVPNLHQGTFVASAPSLAFIGLAVSSTPMPLAEIQARVISRAFYGVLSLPSTSSPLAEPHPLLSDFRTRSAELNMQPDDPTNWRTLHMVRGPEERRLTAALREMLEDAEEDAAAGLFEWDARTEAIAKSMRSIKESELLRLRPVREKNVLEGLGGVDGNVAVTGIPGIKPGNGES
ncbi:MAG: hypothetical protein INR71_13080 [Terriglobus roseus]|nr:hypothetical protein [Terriglobus roseus]